MKGNASVPYGICHMHVQTSTWGRCSEIHMHGMLYRRWRELHTSLNHDSAVWSLMRVKEACYI